MSFSTQSLNGARVPRLAIKDIKEDAISKRLRQFDNTKLVKRPERGTVYINTNEGGTQKSYEAMSQLPLIKEGLHIGFSGWHNFDIMAQRKSGRGLICDLNPENALFLYHVLAILRKSKDRNDFIKLVSDYVNTHSWFNMVGQTDDLSLAIFFAPNLSDDPVYQNISSDDPEAKEIEVELHRKTSWLYTEERFEHIKKLALQDKIALVTENILSAEKFCKIARLLRDNSIPIDTVYISNIAHYIHDDYDKFISTLKALLSDDATILIDANFISPTQLEQRVILSKNLDKMNLMQRFFELRKINSENNTLSSTSCMFNQLKMSASAHESKPEHPSTGRVDAVTNKKESAQEVVVMQDIEEGQRCGFS